MDRQKPREIAVQVLRQRRAEGEFTESLLEKALAGSQQSRADRALCHELVYGVIRWQAALDWLISRRTSGRIQKPGLQELLRLGLYQIFWLDRIPDHAAVNETVELARRGGFGPQAGFVNAVLRGYLREFEETKQILVKIRTTSPHIGWSHPEWLVARWQERWGMEQTAKLLEWNNTPPKTFARVNALKTDPGRLLAQWRDEDVEYDFVHRDWFEENLVFELKSHRPLGDLPSLQQGLFYVQDPGTLLAARVLGLRSGETVLDMCAAPGGKTTYIAQLLENRGRIVACDTSRARLNLIEQNCARLGVSCVETGLSPQLASGVSSYDKILVDAPCSNTGVLRRRIDLRWRIRPGEISRLRQVQLDLLQQAASLLKPSGVIVYSTCSLETEENADVMEQFLAEHTTFRVTLQRGLTPFLDNVDGTYVARLESSH